MGDILIVKEGLETDLIREGMREVAILNFFNMKDRAEKCGYRFMIDSAVLQAQYSYGDFYSEFIFLEYDKFCTIPSLKGISQTTAQIFQYYFMKTPNTPICTEEFSELKKPCALSGFNNGCYEGLNYIFDEYTFLKWENTWFLGNPDKIEWRGDNNEFMPRLDLTERILTREFELHKELKEVKDLVNKKYSLINIFHEGIVAHKGHDKMAYFIEIAKEVLCANYYKYEKTLSDMEHKRTGKIRVIYSLITKSGNQHFISLDFAHGMLEICNDRGDHIGEYRIDGSYNSEATPESHSLRCVKDWLKQKHTKLVTF